MTINDRTEFHWKLTTVQSDIVLKVIWDLLGYNKETVQKLIETDGKPVEGVIKLLLPKKDIIAKQIGSNNSTDLRWLTSDVTNYINEKANVNITPEIIYELLNIEESKIIKPLRR